MTIRNFDELVALAKQSGRRRVAVACADDDAVVQGLHLAWKEGLVEPVLFGDADRIRRTVDKLDVQVEFEIHHTPSDPAGTAQLAVQYVKDGGAQLLMKGQLHTSELLRAVLDKGRGLPRQGIMSHLAFVEISHYHKLFIATDGGLNVSPDLSQKIQIVKNAVFALKTMGYDKPKVGLLSYVEKVRAGDAETEDWAEITRMGQRGDFGDVIIDGPLALDLCLSRRAAQNKKCESPVAADVDAVVGPNITASNASTKALLIEGGMAAGVVVGASVPIIALSRSDTPQMKFYSIAAGSLLL